MATHRAIVVSKYGDESVLELDDSALIPTLDSSTSVLVAVAHAGVNAVDTYIRRGDLRADTPNLRRRTLRHTPEGQTPYTPGVDGAGVVVNVGADCRTVKVGERVFFTMCKSGSYAEHAVVAESHVHPLGELSTEQGAAIGMRISRHIGPYSRSGAPPSATHLRRVWAKRGETVVVHGASGGVGIACVQMARAHGMVVIGTAGSEAGLALITAQSCHYAFDHRSPSYEASIMAATGGKGVDVIIEMMANVNLATDLRLMANGGRTCIVGSRGLLTCDVSPRELMIKETYVTGVVIPATTPEEWAEMAVALNKGIADRWLRPVIDTAFPLSRAAYAHVDVIEHPNGAKGKIVLDISK